MSDKIAVKKSYRDGHIAVHVILKANGYKGDSLKVAGATDLSSDQARDLAKAIIAEADRVDAKVAAKAASEARRKKWRDREVAAGRLKIVSFSELFGAGETAK